MRPNLRPALFLPSLVFLLLFLRFSGASSKDATLTKTFTQDPKLQGQIFTTDVLFTALVASLLDCSSMCSVTSSCESFTFWRSAKPQCQGHVSRQMLSSAQSQEIAGARTFYKNWNSADLLLTNVAVHKSASQGSTYAANLKWSAGKAVDNDFNTDAFKAGTCSITEENGQGNWWMVDLGDVFRVFYVTVTGRSDCCENRVSDFDVNIYTDKPSQTTEVPFSLCYHHAGPLGRGATKNLTCHNGPITGRFVRIQNGVQLQLALCEVEVMAVPLL